MLFCLADDGDDDKYYEDAFVSQQLQDNELYARQLPKLLPDVFLKDMFGIDIDAQKLDTMIVGTKIVWQVNIEVKTMNVGTSIFRCDYGIEDKEEACVNSARK
jgi:hypothetical protein